MTAKFKVVDLPPEVDADADLSVRAHNQHSQWRLVAQLASEITPTPVEWLWPGKIAIGKQTMLAGEAGLGKSQVTISIVAAITKGGVLPCGKSNAPLGSVIILSAEDSAADTLVPRLMAASADLERVCIISAVGGKDGNGRRAFNLQADLALLEAKIAELKEVRLVVIDPISSYLGPKVDSHVNAAVRGVLEPIGEMADRMRVAILSVTHPPKGANTAAINRFIGSIAFVAAARAAFMVTRDADNQDRRLFLPVKNNLAPLGDGLAFWLEQRIVGEPGDGIVASSVTWESEPVTITADQALAATDGNSEQHSARHEAEDFLRENLKEPAKAKDMEEHARAVGISQRTLARARKKLSVIAEKDGMEGGWKWRLPAPGENGGHNLGSVPTPPKNAKPPEECHSWEWQPSGKLAAFGSGSTTQGRPPNGTCPADDGLDIPRFLAPRPGAVPHDRRPALGPPGGSLDDLA